MEGRKEISSGAKVMNRKFKMEILLSTQTNGGCYRNKFGSISIRVKTVLDDTVCSSIRGEMFRVRGDGRGIKDRYR